MFPITFLSLPDNKIYAPIYYPLGSNMTTDNMKRYILKVNCLKFTSSHISPSYPPFQMPFLAQHVKTTMNFSE